MPLQDLTPQLRTRLGRVERTVGLFVALAVFLMLCGFTYYLYHAGLRKGWWLHKAKYFVFLDSAAGVKPNDKVQLMGFDVGWITRIEAQPPLDPYFNVYVEFVVVQPYYGYLWSDSRARVTPADFLGGRVLEVTKGTNGFPSYINETLRDVSLADAFQIATNANLVFNEVLIDRNTLAEIAKPLQPLTREALQRLAQEGFTRIRVIDRGLTNDELTAVYEPKAGIYVPYRGTNKPYWLQSDQSPALTERLDELIKNVEGGLASLFSLTNQLAQILTNATQVSARADAVLADTQPLITNLAVITANLREPRGSLGEWLIPTNLNTRLDSTLGSLDSTLTNANSSMTVLVSNLNVSLTHLASITGNLNNQVQTNSNILSEISSAIVHADDLMQGLKKHWLLRSAFRTNAPPRTPSSAPVHRQRGQR